jgi:hypothetical protein
MRLTPIGSEFESIIAAVILFLFGGVVSFFCCYTFTNIFLCYKRRILRKHRHSILTLESASVVSPEVVVVDAGRLNNSQIYEYKQQKRLSNDSANSSVSTSSTNET